MPKRKKGIKKPRKKAGFNDDVEARAAGIFFGISNLGFLDDKEFSKMIQKHMYDDEAIPHWPDIIGNLRNHLEGFAESDGDWKLMQEEIKVWTVYAKNNDDYVLGQWNKMSQELNFKTSIKNFCPYKNCPIS